MHWENSTIPAQQFSKGRDTRTALAQHCTALHSTANGHCAIAHCAPPRSCTRHNTLTALVLCAGGEAHSALQQDALHSICTVSAQYLHAGKKNEGRTKAYSTGLHAPPLRGPARGNWQRCIYRESRWENCNIATPI